MEDYSKGVSCILISNILWDWNDNTFFSREIYMIFYESPQHLSFMKVIWWYFFTIIYLLSQHSAGHHHHPWKFEHDRLMVLSKLGRKFQNLVTQHHGRFIKLFPIHSNKKYLVGLEQQHILFTRNIHDSLRITLTSILYASHMMIFLHTYLSLVPTQCMSSPRPLQNWTW